MEPDNHRQGFTVLPAVSSVSPSTGSLKGGTSCTITGTGLCDGCKSNRKRRSTGEDDDSVTDSVIVNIGTVPCDVQSGSFDEIICVTTMPFGRGTQDVSVMINSKGTALMASCEGPCSFSFESFATPTVSAVSPSVIEAYGSLLTISGTQFGTDPSNVAVSIGDNICMMESVSDNQITCTVRQPIVGTQPFSVIVLDKGIADSSVRTLDVAPAISHLSTDQGSTQGYLDLGIHGIGFGQVTTVKIDGIPCQVELVSPSMVVCRTPPHQAGHVNVSMELNS